MASRRTGRTSWQSVLVSWLSSHGFAVLQHLVHVGFVIPWLHVEQDGRLGNQCWFLGFLLMISLQPGLHLLCLLLSILIIVGTKKVHVIIILVISCCRCSSTSSVGRGILARLSELLHAGAK